MNTSDSYNTTIPGAASICLWAKDDISKFDAFLFIIIFVTAVIGNIIVFVCYARFRVLRTMTNVFIVSLSASDLMVACVSMPFTYAVLVCGSTPKIKDDHFDIMVYKVCDMVPSVWSIYSLTLVAIDRAIAIKEPFVHRQYVTRRTAWLAVTLVCLLAVSYVSLVFAVDPMPFTIFIILVAYALPVSIMVICYSVIGFVAKSHAKELTSRDRTATRLRCESSASRDSTPTGSSIRTAGRSSVRSVTKTSFCSSGSVAFLDDKDNDQPPHNQCKRSWRINNFFNRSLRRLSGLSHARLMRREVKGAMTLALILGCFILSWTPFIAINFQFSLCPKCPINESVVKYFKVLHYSNSAVNPLLYILLNKQWRAAFKSTVFCESKHKKKSDSNTELYSW